MEMETPIPEAARRRSSIATTPLLDFYTQNRQPAGDKQVRRPTDELRRQLSLTPSQTRRSSLTSVYSNGSVSKNTTTSTRKVSPQEVDEMLKNVLELARRNHITEGNVWKLTLIDHLKQLHRADGSVDFDKASAGLGAAIQIYSKRVDSALTQALDALNRMDMKVKDKMKGRNSRGDDDGEDVPITQTQTQVTTQKRGRKRAATLVTEESITAKANDAEQRDYLFEKSCAEFDERGFNGMRMAKSSVCRGLEIIVDLNDTKEGPPSVDPGHCMVDAASFAGIDAPVNEAFAPDLFAEFKSLLGSSHVPERMETYKAVIDDAVDVLRNRPPQSYTDMTMEMKDDLMDIPLPLESMDAEPCAIEEPPDIDIDLGDGDGNDSDFGAGGPDAFNDPADDAAGIDFSFFDKENEASALEPLDMPDAPGDAPLGEGMLPPGDTETMVPDAPEAGPSGEELQSLLEHLQIAPVGKRAARSAHWKFNPAKAPASPRPQRKRHRKKKLAIDYEKLPEIDYEEELALPTNTSTIDRKSRNTVPCPLESEDSRLKPIFLAKLSLHTSMGGLTRDRRSNAIINQETHGEFDILFEHDDNDDDNIAFPDVGDVSFDGIDGGGLGDVNVYDEDGLVMEPPKVQETIVELPKYAKQVDMDALKCLMWERIQHLAQSGTKEDISFQEVLYGVPEASSAGRREDISVPICLVALLHIANEHELEVTNSSDLSEVHIKIP